MTETMRRLMNSRFTVTNKYRKTRIYHELLECSEKSYNPAFSNQAILHNLIFLNFSLNWLYMVTLANFFLLCSSVYKLVFDVHMKFLLLLFIITIVCNILIIIDLVSMIMHKCNREVASTRPIDPVKLVFILIDVFSLPAMVLPIDYIMSNKLSHYIRIGFGCMRCYRLFKYFYMCSISYNKYTATKMFATFGLLCGVTIHISTCILQMICTDCKKGVKKQTNWYGEMGMQIFFNSSTELTPSYIYLMGVYTILGIFTKVGYTGAAPQNLGESIFVSFLSLLAMFIMTGAFMGAFVFVRITNQRMQHEFFSNLVLIKNNLERDQISMTLKNVILTYYKFLWEKEKGIKHSSVFQALPSAIRNQVTLDKYWQSLEQSYILRDETEEFRREVSSHMYTQIMVKGETIYELGEMKNAMAYIAKGSVQLLSRYDGESSILTLGAGSLLGEMTLLYSYRCKVMVRAESYCVIYYLNKSDFWKLRSIHCVRKRSISIHNKWNIKFDECKHSLATIKANYEQFCFLANVKKNLITEKEIRLANDSGVLTKGLVRTNKSLSSLYILSELDTVLNYDDIFAKTTWPWIFHPRSQVIVLWDLCLLVLIVVNAIILPYTLIISGEDDVVGQLMRMILPVTSFFYILDVIGKLFVGIEIDNVLHLQVSDIFGYRITELVFILDVLAALPFYLFSENYWNINMLMKVGQVVMFMVNVEKSLVFNVVIVRCVKYIIFIIYCTYFFAVLFIWISCIWITKEVCIKHTWIKLLNLNSWIPQRILVMTMNHVLSILSQTDGLFASTLTDMTMTTILAVLGAVLFLYIFSEFTASRISNEKLKQWYIELVYNIEKYMQANDTAKEIRDRMRSFLELQWLIDKGLKKHELYKDLPDDLYKELQIDKYLNLCSNLPLFQDIDRNVLQSLVQYCRPLFLPPNELIVHEGDFPDDIFIIEKGYCEILCVEKQREIIGTPSYFGEIEILLDKPAKHTVRAVTHVSLVSISRKRFLDFLNGYPTLKTRFSILCDELNTSILVHRVFNDKSSIDTLLLEHEKTKSWFIFPKQKRDPLAKDYEIPFTKIGSFKFLRLLLLRRTFLPDGKFIIRWEVFRAILAVLSAFMGPSIFVLLSLTKHIQTICYCFDTIYLLDMYLRLHGSYYNDKGILVTHPFKTAQRYITSSFLVDFISTLPYFTLMFSSDNLLLFCTINFLKVLQLYRLPWAICTIKKNGFRQNNLLENCLLFMPLLIIFINTSACAHLLLLNDIYLDETGRLWLRGIRNIDNLTNSVLDKYYKGLYRVTTYTFTLGLISRKGRDMDLFILFASCILIGYLMLSYALLIVMEHQASISLHLTAIQNNTRSLVKYMKRESIPAQLQKDTLQYYEIFWRRSNHMIQEEVLKRCHSGLTQDWVLYMYGETLSKVPVFYEMGNTFYKMIGSYMKSRKFLSGATIVKLNDIVDAMYIVNQGFVRVLGPNGAILDHLEQGSLFGNIDDVPKSRSMITIIAIKPVDLICIESTQMYFLLKSYPVVINRLNKHILIKCLAYISADTIPGSKLKREDLKELHPSDLLAIEYKTWNIDVIYIIMTSYYTRCFLMLCSYASTTTVLTIIAFDVPLKKYVYMLDAIIFIKILLTLFTPYVNNVGEVIKDKKLIWKRYVKSTEFAFEIMGILPLEIVGFLIPNNIYLRTNGPMINRVFRLFAVQQYFSKAYADLNVNMLRVKLTTVILYTFLLVHCTACFVFYTACPNGSNCPNGTWLQYDGRGTYSWKFTKMYGYEGRVLGCLKDDHYYTCSVLYAVSLITLTGYPFPRPLQLVHTDSLVVCIILVLCRIIVASLMGHLFGLMRHLSYEVMEHNYTKDELKHFLRQSEISPHLTMRILNYVNHLWIWQKAVQLPTLMIEAPPYISEQIKIAAYGYHLNDNLIFQDCHPDFVRQLVRELNVENYFDGDMICQQGDLNETMYFIHRGIVDVLRIDNNIETVVDILTELDTFGVYQGLYPCIPHTHSYQSKSVTVVLTLKRTHWFHLLRFYPASRLTIFDTLTDIAQDYAKLV